jgi:three-Cys-motif partner protein
VDSIDDGGPVAVVGEWAEEKLTLLRRYIEISAGTRAKYVDRTEATYIDLYGGPGLIRIRGSDDVQSGSPLVALEAATQSSVRFNRYFVADLSAEFSKAARGRLVRRGAVAARAVGKAERTVGEIVPELNEYGLHFALLDPFNLDDLPFSVIDTLSRLKRIDLMIHLSTGDLQRNFRERYRQGDSNTLRRFAPGWNPPNESGISEQQMREDLVQHWFKLLQEVGFGAAARMHAVRNSTRSTMYWLVFVSKHELAKKFWNVATEYLNQPQLF